MEEDLLRESSSKLQGVLPSLEQKPKSKSSSYEIGGVRIEFPFPFEAYPAQKSMMEKVIQGCNQAENCLLESPSGSGKTLALLCSVLAWQRKEKELVQQQILQAQQTKNAENELRNTTSTNVPLLKPPASNSPLFTPNQTSSSKVMDSSSTAGQGQSSDLTMDIHRDGEEDFLPSKRIKLSPDVTSIAGTSSSADNLDSTMSSSSLSDESVEKVPVSSVPTIFYGTRTHKQITQIVRELKKTVYKDQLRMTILSSRKHTCINKEVRRSKKNINDHCQELKETENNNCSYLCELNEMGLPPITAVWDIEELVTIGEKHSSCPYYVARELVNTADIVFCPYNYVIDPLIRKSLELKIDKSIILLDEAHNIEDVSRESASGSFELNDINATLQECEQLGNIGLPKFKSSLSQWVDANASTKKGTVSWSGSDFVTSFENHGMGPDECDKHFKTCLSQINSSEDELRAAPKKNRMDKLKILGGRSKNLLSNIEFILGLLFKGANCEDYHVCMESAVAFDQGESNRWYRTNRAPMSIKYTLHFWCLNSALVFADIRDSARSVILTSGTLAPVDSFQSELGTQFPIKLEANHVIDKDQVFIGALGRGPTNFPLIATYKNRQDNDFQDELGRLVLGVCEIVPYGVLCFLPSYAYLKQLFKRWSSTGLMNQISKHKSVFREPRSNKEPKDIMQKYFAAIKQAEQNVNTNTTTGALLFAVFRGKISEGIDFPDNCARSVISVGIPFPSVQDEKVKLKKVYNDTHSQKKGLLKGGDWYQIQAFRALNQGLGRCIRHRKDWGAILLVDLRFNSFQEKLSKWVRNQVQNSSTHASFMENLKTFVRRRIEIQQEEERCKLEEDNLNEEKAENNDTPQSDNASSSPAKTEGTCDTQDTASSTNSEDNFTFSMDGDNHVVVYTDGACSRNGMDNAAAGFGVFFGERNPLNLSGKVTGRVTNNHAEIQGAINAIKQAKKANIDKICIKTDSKFMISCITEWMPKWKHNGWRRADGKPVLNKEELMILNKEITNMGSVKWEYVPAHALVAGNEEADRMAKEACGQSCDKKGGVKSWSKFK
uniref:DNA 5'-3' helicase n=1 Tax=Cacopsylla melanoneura TaxID=428564 RepID=A0A8D9B2P9_9HEMI